MWRKPCFPSVIFRFQNSMFPKAQTPSLMGLPLLLQKPTRIILLGLYIWFWTAFFTAAGISLLHGWQFRWPSLAGVWQSAYGLGLNFALVLIVSVWTLPLMWLLLWLAKTRPFVGADQFFWLLGAGIPLLFFGLLGELRPEPYRFAGVLITSASAALNAWHWPGNFFKKANP